MRVLKSTKVILKALLFIAFGHLAGYAYTQSSESTAHFLNVKGSVSVTNNGFSFIPSFSLGDPATIVNLSVSGGKRFSFEPQFRYALEGRPWSFIFIWRYKVIKTDRFQFTLGTHLPSLNFNTETVEREGATEDFIQTRRFFPVFEAFPNYSITNDISVSLYYLYGRGAKEVAIKNTHFLSLRANFSDIKLTKQFYLKFNPQFFYLRGDDNDGFYVASGLTLAMRDFPLSISTVMNKPIQTDIAGGKDFDWNISLVYSFGGNFVKS
jgi:hypothetical protein